MAQGFSLVIKKTRLTRNFSRQKIVVKTIDTGIAVIPQHQPGKSRKGNDHRVVVALKGRVYHLRMKIIVKQE